MLDSEEYKKPGNGKRYNTSIERTMSENGSIWGNVIGKSSENVGEDVSEIQTLTQKEVSEQIRGFVAPLTRQLEELTGLVQRIVTTPHPIH